MVFEVFRRGGDNFFISTTLGSLNFGTSTFSLPWGNAFVSGTESLRTAVIDIPCTVRHFQSRTAQNSLDIDGTIHFRANFVSIVSITITAGINGIFTVTSAAPVVGGFQIAFFCDLTASTAGAVFFTNLVVRCTT